MIIKKEFYFVRHGQTDHNALESTDKGDQPKDIPLNERGRSQAMAIEPLIASLPVKAIGASPMKRVQETKEIITARLQVPHFEIEELGECSSQIWKEMRNRGMYVPLPIEGEALLFMDRVRKGINKALSQPGPILIVAHGGVHWATCCLLGIDDHEWAIDNCTVVHFSLTSSGKWAAKRL